MAQEINIYLSDDQMLEDVGNAFNSRTRRDILRLCANKSYSIYGLAEALNMAIPTISFTLKFCKKRGLSSFCNTPTKRATKNRFPFPFQGFLSQKRRKIRPFRKIFIILCR